MPRRRLLGSVLLVLLACDRRSDSKPEPPPPSAPVATEKPATAPASYRVNPSLPHGSLVVQVRARAPAESRKVEIANSYRARNPQEAAFCDVADERLVVDPASLGIRNVAVSLRSLAEGLLPPLPRETIDNSGCAFVPHVLFAPVGSKILLKNTDPMSHGTMISTIGGTTLFTVTIPSGETAETTTVDAPGILAVTCPMHAWMQGWVIGARHPYVAVTGSLGDARLDKVPAGAHDVVFWHETLGTVSRKVDVAAGSEHRIDLDDAAFQKR